MKATVALDGTPASNPTAQSQSPLNLKRRIHELDGLRGFAILMVVFVHYVWYAIAAQPSPFLAEVKVVTRPFWSAVDLFFLLSGFLIGGNLLDARESPNYFSTFYIRRFSRVLPVYFLLLATAVIGYFFSKLPVGAPLQWLFGGKLPWYSYLTFAQNLYIAKWNTPGAILLVFTWAFAVEVQFYMIVPAVLRFVRDSALPYIFIAGILTAPVVRLFIALHFPTKLDATYVLLPCRMDSLFLGLLCAYCLRKPEIWNRLLKRRDTLWIFFLFLVAGIPVLNSDGIPFTFLWIIFGYGWMSALYATAMILALTNSQSMLTRALRWSWLTGIGTISYGIYLFHYVFYALCMAYLRGQQSLLVDWKDAGATLLALALTIAFSTLSWLYLEKPILRASHRWTYFPGNEGPTPLHDARAVWPGPAADPKIARAG